MPELGSGICSGGRHRLLDVVTGMKIAFPIFLSCSAEEKSLTFFSYHHTTANEEFSVALVVL